MQNSAALPWYDFPSTRDTLDSVWLETRRQLNAAGVPHSLGELDHVTPHRTLLTSADLALSQCCGLDLFRPHTNKVTPFAVPVISALPVESGMYFSYIVARRSANLQTPRVAVNEHTSHSGHTAIQIWLAANNITQHTAIKSGSHAQSIVELCAGRADVAAIDALSWQLLTASDGPFDLEILGISEPALAPPFIMGVESTIDAATLTIALNTALQRHGQPLGITGATPIERSDYLKVAALARQYRRE